MTEPGGAVFLSYASEDGESAARICEALRAAGIEVWFDRSELRGGDSWDAAIRRQIKSCALFIPLISANSRARAEGYFRLEWKLAVDRSHLMAADRAFLLPVVVDAAHEGDARVPDKFWDVQWSRLPNGEPTRDFVDRVTLLLAPEAPRPTRPNEQQRSVAPPAAGNPAPASTRRPPLPKARLATLVLGAVLVAGIGYLSLDRLRSRGMPPAATAPAASERSIAILPFVDMSEKKDQEYFSDGIAEELIDLVTRGTDLRVPARTSSFYFKGKQVTIAEIAQALTVANVLEGSIRKSGNTIRVTVQLIRAADGYHLWSATYDRELKDLFEVQDDIASAVVEALKSRLAATPAASSLGRPANPAAHGEYLLGRQFFNYGNSDGFKDAIAAYRRAIALDPRYAAAYAGLAVAEAYWADNGGDAADIERAVAHADRAIVIAPDLADGFVARGWIRFSRQWDWDGARADLERALQLDVGDATTERRYGGLLAALGRLPDAVSAARKAIDMDPLSNAAWGNLGVYYNALGRSDEARKALSRALEINPDSAYAHWNLAQTELLDSRIPQALAALPKPETSAFHQAGAAMAQHSLGQDARSREILQTLIASGGERWAYQIAEVYAWRREPDQAFDWLQRAYDQHDGGLIQIKYDRLLAALRSDPRYAALLRRMNLPR